MSDTVNPLYYHYETGIKLDYFILSADVALLGWTIVNTEWLPKGNAFIWLIAGFWVFIILSLISGVIRQLYNGMIFGLNHQYLHSGELASQIERSALQGGGFIDQQTGAIKSSEDFKKFAEPLRLTEKKAKELWKKYEKRAELFANLAVCLLVIALFFLVLIKISSLMIQS